MEEKKVKKVLSTLTDKQKELLNKMDELFSEFADEHLEIIYNHDEGAFYALNIENLMRGEFKLDYKLTEEERENAVAVLDPLEMGNDFGVRTTLDFNIVIPRFDDVLVINEIKE